MFERFTDRARRVVVLAQAEARLLEHNYIGTEHLLLGLLSEREGVAAEALESLGVSLETARHEVVEITGRGQHAPTGQIPFTPRAKKVLELSLREALQLGHNYIGTEHILLGLVREGEGVAAQVLTKAGAGLNRVRERVGALLSQRPPAEAVTPEPGGRARAPFAFGVAYPHGRPVPAPQLQRVVPIARDVEVGEGARLVLLSLEIWSDWLDLRLATVGPGAARPPNVPLTPMVPYGAWTLSDDRGTAYQNIGASLSADNQMQVCQVSFSPSPPAEAKRLTMTLAADGGGGGSAREEIRVVVELA
jgi:hypothetical protein